MKIIVGLGNPGKQYGDTPHNMGFRVVDDLAEKWGGTFKFQKKFKAETMETRIGNEPVLLAKPATWMNLSGVSVAALLRNRPEALERDFLVISDDFNLGLGKIRIRARGSAGGHNGLKSLIEHLADDEFARLRIGVMPERKINDWSNFVLSLPRPKDRERQDHMVPIAAEAAEIWIREGTESAANFYNGRNEFESGEELS